MDDQEKNTLIRDIKRLQEKTDKQQKEIDELKKQIESIQAK